MLQTVIVYSHRHRQHVFWWILFLFRCFSSRWTTNFVSASVMVYRFLRQRVHLLLQWWMWCDPLICRRNEIKQHPPQEYSRHYFAFFCVPFDILPGRSRRPRNSPKEFLCDPYMKFNARLLWWWKVSICSALKVEEYFYDLKWCPMLSHSIHRKHSRRMLPQGCLGWSSVYELWYLFSLF